MKQNQKDIQKQQIPRPQSASQVLSNSSQKSKIVLDDDNNDSLNENQFQEKLLYDQQFKKYENYRSYLLQYQFLNATLQDKMNKQQQQLEIQFTDRLQQLKDMIDSNIQLQTKILRERAINALEEVLAIEYKNYKEIFSKLDEFSDYAKNLQEFLNGSLKKVYLDSGFSINIDQVNQYLTESQQLIEKIIEKHDDFFKEYPLIAQTISEIIQETTVQIRAINQIQSFLSDIKLDQNAKIEEKVKEEYFRSKGLAFDYQSDEKNQNLTEEESQQINEKSDEEEKE